MEWTTEFCDYEGPSTPVVSRGGTNSNETNINPSSYRQNCATHNANQNVGFRITLFI